MAVTIGTSPFLPGEDGLDGPFPAKCPTLFPERCLNSFYRQANCARCVEACPVAAIQLDDNSVTLDQSSCLRCGICRLACPTAVFVETTPPEARLVEGARDVDDTKLELACPWVTGVNTKGEPILKSRVPRATCLATARCLGALSPADLLDLARLGEREVWLHDAACRDCPISHAQNRLLATVHEANAWLSNFGAGPSLHTYTKHLAGEPDQPELRLVAILPARSIARRSFLRKAVGLEATGSAAVETAGHLPQERERLITLLGKIVAPPDVLNANELPIASLQVDAERCSACGLCSKFCPTGALTFLTDEEDVFGLFFAAGACVDCGICALACPENAIAYGNHLPGDAFLAERPTRLVAGRLKQCPDCQARIAQSSNHTKCFVCRRRSRPAFLVAP